MLSDLSSDVSFINISGINKPQSQTGKIYSHIRQCGSLKTTKECSSHCCSLMLVCIAVVSKLVSKNSLT